MAEHREYLQSPSFLALSSWLLMKSCRSSAHKFKSNNVTSNPCRFFYSTGTCKYGHNCRFSHSNHPSNPHRPGFQPQRTNLPSYSVGYSRNTIREGGKLQRWKHLMAQGSQIGRPSLTAVSEFFQVGLELMDGDVGATQDVIRLFVTDPGLSFVRDVTDHHLPQASNNQEKLTIWANELRPLFRLVTHSRVIDSAVLEQEVAVLFNFILGVAGSRMLRLFTFIISLLEAWPATTRMDCSLMETTELSLAVLTKIIDCNTTNIVNKSFQPVVDQFTFILHNVSDSVGGFSQMQAAKYLEYVQRRLGVGHEIPLMQDSTSQTLFREKFILRRDLPGNLSPDGPRHDNDHPDITDIRIMPTYQEINSPRAEFLPTSDSSQWHKQGIQGRLDREFRLLREDTVGQLRDAIRDKLEAIRNIEESGRRHHAKTNIRTSTYDFPTPVQVILDKTGSLEFLVQCHQPEAVKMFKLSKRREWWLQSKRLLDGALVCVMDATGSVLYFVVSETTLRARESGKITTSARGQGESSLGTKEAEKPSLSDNEKFAYVSLRLVDPTDHDVGQALHWYQNVGPSVRRYLIEFPGVMLASFKHTLEALQEMHRKPDIPFTDLIAPSNFGSEVTIRPPPYSNTPGFAFHLQCLAIDNKDIVFSPQRLRPGERDQIATRTSLDATQSAAFIDSLSRELSLIQGPPGTGKSFTGEKIIKALIANKKQGQLGPILCVCYTNHALDQLLEHLVDDGVKKLIRVGSRSKSERLEGYNLRAVSRAATRTKTEKRSLYELDNGLRDSVAAANRLLQALSVSDSWKSVKNFIAEKYPHQHAELFGKDDDGFMAVLHKPESVVERWLHHKSDKDPRVRPLNELEQACLSEMSSSERRILHQHWLRSIRDALVTGIITEHLASTRTREQRDRVRSDVDLRCLQEADVVGVTTTGMARNLQLLRKLRCKVLVCEEAGEVLEAHILTALLPSVEHAILIGDHLQLRPQIQNYELQSANPRGEQYSLDISLFERLIRPPHANEVRVPFSILETQRRMHPSIADLIRSTLYPQLIDGENTKNYPEVSGMKKRLFWFHHEELEAGASSQEANSTSHWNSFEIEMTVALVSHLVRQGGYGQGDIAVITPYLGQLHKLRHKMETMFEVCMNDRDKEDLEAFEAEGTEAPPPARKPVAKTTLLKSVRAATVDNFQGEEAKIVVISLVRSNHQKQCGFLRSSNRINVLLSRAKHGMYLIGNASTYGQVSMWSKVIGMLQDQRNFGTSLELQCPRHPLTSMLVSRPDHFVQVAPESGCNLPCDKRLKCGHRCPGRCHSDVLHAAVKCLERCPRMKKGCEHICPRVCGDPCYDRCITMLTNINLVLPCGHVIRSALCWAAQNPANIQCLELVKRVVPGCQHQVIVRCHEDVTTEKFRCEASCGHNRQCGHTCKSPCHFCRTRKDSKVVNENHGICSAVCGRTYKTCRHTCQKACHAGTQCGPCVALCENRCCHSRCNKRCSEPCSPCAEGTCNSRCQHSECTMPCAAPCDWIPCSKRCEKILDCGHQCPSLCAEACPSTLYCQQCGSEEIKATIVDFLEMKQFHEINLDEEPCIFPDCGHFLTRTSMDGQMDVSAHYEVDSLGNISAIKASTKPFSMNEVKVCASCRGSLRSISRYGRIVRRAMLDEASKKFIAWSNHEYIELADKLLQEQQKLEKATMNRILPNVTKSVQLSNSKSRMRQLQTIVRCVGTSRYDSLIRLRQQINSYAGLVRKEEQPFHRVKDLVNFANHKNSARGTFSFDESIIQLKGTLLAGNLLLKCDILVLSDFLRLRAEGIQCGTDAKLDLSTHLADCDDLIKLAHVTKHVRQEVESHVYFAQLCSFSTAPNLASQPVEPDKTSQEGPSISSQATKSENERWKTSGLEHVAKARALVEKHPSASVFQAEIDAAEHMLKDAVSYSTVTADELRAVYDAMASEFMGTGHWYVCQEGHPFTVGECGMPMQSARCPECDSPIGGANHRPADGVRRDVIMEELGRPFRQIHI
ncbi:hypothetical protein F5Y19DRAFT_69978 [Xylariaceae sp. FL1651]|nr:hypothetical protein F5Y19DRAFT_69978 [Xylariaceae sp. FL1651]